MAKVFGDRLQSHCVKILGRNADKTRFSTDYYFDTFSSLGNYVTIPDKDPSCEELDQAPAQNYAVNIPEYDGVLDVPLSQHLEIPCLYTFTFNHTVQ